MSARTRFALYHTIRRFAGPALAFAGRAAA